MESRETRERVSRQLNWIEISTLMLTNVEEQSLIGLLIVIVRSKRSTVKMKRSTMDCFKNVVIVGSEMKGPDASLEMRYNNASISLLGSRSDGPDAPRAVQSGPL